MLESQWSDWLFYQVSGLTEHIRSLSPSECAEQKRYLPNSVTTLPGYYRYSVAPYLREIIDCLDINSPIREVSLMKGAQLGATVGILENFILYSMDVVKSAPTMLLTADAELAQLRMESYITPMIQQSGLTHLIQSSDETNSRKTGKTDKKIEWVGGGFLLPFGARNAAKLRSTSIRFLLEDEVDAFPEYVGKDGDPAKLAEERTKAYHNSRKVARTSTPLLLGKSRIAKAYAAGDQRKYLVPCRACGAKQELKFQGENTGLVWSYNPDGTLDKDSVRYVCGKCGHKMRNEDKAWFLPRGQWVPTAVPKDPTTRSYHLSALYSPVEMYPWSAIVQDWLDAWDVENHNVKDMFLLQVFYNNNLGVPFEAKGDGVSFRKVSAHRREYDYQTVPNSYARQHCGSDIKKITCSVDVHHDKLLVGAFGWTRGSNCFLLDYFEIPGNTSDIDDQSWGQLSEWLLNAEYQGDGGERYTSDRFLTLIDSGDQTDVVYSFCRLFQGGVYPCKGGQAKKGSASKEFHQTTVTLTASTEALPLWIINVDMYKDRWSAILRREWCEDIGFQPRGHFNAPQNCTDRQLRELTTEYKRQKVDGRGRVSYEWHRPNKSRNELWDLLMYATAGLEIIARNEWEGDPQDFTMDAFFDNLTNYYL